MSELRLAGSGISELGYKFGHFQVVFVHDDGKQEEIEVYPGGKGTGGLPSLGTWNYLGPRDHTAPNNTAEYTGENTPEYGEKYKWVKIMEGPVADNGWKVLKDVHQEFIDKGENIPYLPLELNSNTYVTTILSVIGVNIDNYADEAKPESVISFPGVSNNLNVLKNPAYAIDLNIQGTDGDDIIKTGLKDDVLTGLGGNDTLDGGGGNDRLDGGLGDDIMTGGSDNDQFIPSTGSNTITDFDPGKDSLWVPPDTTWSFNSWANTTILTYLNGTVALEGVDLTPIAENYPWLKETPSAAMTQSIGITNGTSDAPGNAVPWNSDENLNFIGVNPDAVSPDWLMIA